MLLLSLNRWKSLPALFLVALCAAIGAVSIAGFAAAQSARDVSVKPVPKNTREKQNTGEKRRVALVIGNAAYEVKKNELKNPVHDAEDVKAALEQHGFTVSLGINLKHPAMKKEVDKFVGGVRTGDIALFYYAGHGMQIDGENLLVPVDFSSESESHAKESCIHFDSVQHALEKSEAAVSILVMDACRTNPFQQHRAWGRGLAAAEAGLGSYIAFAASPGETAEDNSSEKNGLFTKFFLATLKQPPPLSQLFRKVRDDVYHDSHARQTPYVVDQIIGDFSFTNDSPPPLPSIKATEDLLEAGLRLYRQQKCAEALEYFDRAVRSNPQDAFAQNAAGMAYVCQHLFTKAIERFNNAIQLKPDLAGAYLNRGDVYLAAGNNQLAVEDFTWAIEQQPQASLFYTRRGRAYFGIRKYEESLADYNRAIGLNPADAQAFYGRGQVLQRQGKYPDALNDYRAALERKTDYEEARGAVQAVQERIRR